MKARLSANGELRVIAETELEAYALKTWFDIQMTSDWSAFVFGIDLGEWNVSEDS